MTEDQNPPGLTVFRQSFQFPLSDNERVVIVSHIIREVEVLAGWDIIAGDQDAAGAGYDLT